jgi:hypothetical protein
MTALRRLGRPRRYAVPPWGSRGTPWAPRRVRTPADDVNDVTIVFSNGDRGGDDPALHKLVECGDCSAVWCRGPDGDECPFCAFARGHAPLRLDDGPGDVGVCRACFGVWTPVGGTPAGGTYCPHCASRDTGRASLLCRACDVWVPLDEWSEHGAWCVRRTAPPCAA